MSYRIIYENIIGRDVFFYYVCPFCGTNHKLKWSDLCKPIGTDDSQLFHISKQKVVCHECDTAILLFFRNTK